MDILRIAQNVYPEQKGGASYHVHALSRDQATMGHGVTVLTTYDDPKKPRVEQRSGYTVIRYQPQVSPLGNDVSVGLAKLLSQADAFDIIHAHSHLYFSTNLAALRRWLDGIPLAITNHGLFSQSAPEWVFDLYLSTLGRWTFNQADVVFCYTEADRQRVRSYGVHSDIAVVPNGIDTDRFTPDGPDSELINADGPVVLFVGRLVDGKRPQLAVEAFKRIQDNYPDATLYFCGTGPLHDSLVDQIAEYGIEDAVSFLGHVPYDQMPAIYRSSDVLVLPSRAEGVPRTVLEALASGTPVVTSDLKQITSVVGDQGYTVQVSNGERLAEAMIKAINEKKSSEDDQAGVEHEWTQTVQRTTNILNKVVSNH